MMSQNSLKFRRFILSIAAEFTSDDRTNLAYVLHDIIPAGKREALSNKPSGLFEELERGGRIGPGKLDFLRDLLNAIRRQDLVCEVDKFDRPNAPLLTQKFENYLESSSYRLAIKGGKHLVNDKGDDYVELQSGESYALVIHNFNSHRCNCEIKIDGHVRFPGLVIEAESECALDRPSDSAGKFKFFAVRDAPPDSGIDERNTEENGRIQVTFTAEVAELEIVCYIGDCIKMVTCSLDTTDVTFHQWISSVISCDTATILVHGWQPLGKRNIKLTDYGVKNGTRVFVNFGIVGGTTYGTEYGMAQPISKLECSNVKAPVVLIEWIPGATTMQGVSKQTVVDIIDFVPNTKTKKVVLNLRLIARADEVPLKSKGKCTQFILGNHVPPPV